MVGRIKAMPSAEVILLTAYGNIPDGVQAIKNGAFDYITKGDDNNKDTAAAEPCHRRKRRCSAGWLVSRTNSPKSIRSTASSVRRNPSAVRSRWHARSPSRIPRCCSRVKPEPARRFLRRPSTTPARARRGVRRAVNCSAFSKELLESELPGHRAGSFTGATKDKKGLFEEADKGDAFLDEIGEMPVELQAKLLRVLECGEFIKIGETRPTKVDLRIIAATNRDLEKGDRFREFPRRPLLPTFCFRIHLPLLRERPGDIAEYARFFAAQFADRMGRRIDTIDKGYIAALERHAWHGNVRELRTSWSAA